MTLPPMARRAGRLNGGDRRYPVVYYLHGGRPGSELLGAGMAACVAAAMEAGTVPLGSYPIVTLEKQLLSMIGNHPDRTWCKVVELYCEVTIGYNNPRCRRRSTSSSTVGRSRTTTTRTTPPTAPPPSRVWAGDKQIGGFRGFAA
jgi:hypothetical protein